MTALELFMLMKLRWWLQRIYGEEKGLGFGGGGGGTLKPKNKVNM